MSTVIDQRSSEGLRTDQVTFTSSEFVAAIGLNVKSFTNIIVNLWASIDLVNTSTTPGVIQLGILRFDKPGDLQNPNTGALIYLNSFEIPGTLKSVVPARAADFITAPPASGQLTYGLYALSSTIYVNYSGIQTLLGSAITN